jgi:FtsH-binding integral membrane protein
MVDVDLEKGGVASDFAESIIRKGFVKKVFGLLSVQLFITALIGAVMVFSEGAKAFVASNPAILVLSMLASFGLILTFAFSETARQKHPLNLILLFSFTVAEGVLVGVASSQYDTGIVVSAFGITAAVSAGLCLYATTTKKDYTASGALLYSVLVALVCAMFLGIFIKSSILHMAISCVGAILFSCYIVYDVQILLGGSHKHKISPDEYVAATISIYLDIINLFLHMLHILNELNRR